MTASNGVFEDLFRGLLQAGEATLLTFVDGEWTEEERESGRSSREALHAFARVIASTLGEVREKIPDAPREPSSQTVRLCMIEDELDELAEHIDALTSAIHPQAEDDQAGLPAGDPIPAHLIEVFRGIAAAMAGSGATEEEARLALLREVRDPDRVPGGRLARRLILRAKRRFGPVEIARARRLLTVPAIFSVLFARPSEGRA